LIEIARTYNISAATLSRLVALSVRLGKNLFLCVAMWRG